MKKPNTIICVKWFRGVKDVFKRFCRYKDMRKCKKIPEICEKISCDNRGEMADVNNMFSAIKWKASYRPF